MKYVWIPALLAILLAGAVCFGAGAIVFWGTVLGFLVAILTVAGAMAYTAAQREAFKELAERPAVGRKLTAWAAAILIMVGYVFLAMAVLSKAREYGKSPITHANLRAVGFALKQYATANHEYPTSLQELISLDELAPRSLHSFGDPQRLAHTDDERVPYSSFVYQPGLGEWRSEPQLILAYERLPWTPMNLRIKTRYGRCVLFADGNVRRLAEHEFTAAKADDAARRGEVGWPPP